MKRPKLNKSQFEIAVENAGLTELEVDILEYIRYNGIFDELSLRKALSLPSKPPALYRLNKICEKVAIYLPTVSNELFKWSKQQNPDYIAWKGNLVCSIGFNCDGDRLEPESGTVLYHTFIIHKELFNGFGDND
tara:strand:+ start:232 stop:633 length:402 start_codon:yes stop_codon:yes gene_type:complete